MDAHGPPFYILYIFYILYTVKLPPAIGLGAGRAKQAAERQWSLCRPSEFLPQFYFPTNAPIFDIM
ncbi:MAG TPA: hypothetical protein DD637_04390 [Verrucomicrobia bacterium]|nr:hypothetical protein [Verrucomicrobiota bacterium]